MEKSFKSIIDHYNNGLSTLEESVNCLIGMANNEEYPEVMEKIVPLLSTESIDCQAIFKIFEGVVESLEKKEKERELDEIKKGFIDLVKDYGTIQENAHRLLIRAVIYCWKERDCEVIKFACKTLDDVSGSFRIEAVTYWLQHVAGMAVTYSEKDGWNCSFCVRAKSKPKYVSSLGINFTYDKKHLAICKEDGNRFWKIAPKQPKVLKLPEPEKVFVGSVAQLARLIALNPQKWDEVSHVIDGLKDAIQQESKSTKTKEWIDNFILSNPSSTPPVDSEEEAAEMARIASLEE